MSNVACYNLKKKTSIVTKRCNPCAMKSHTISRVERRKKYNQIRRGDIYVTAYIRSSASAYTRLRGASKNSAS